MIQIPEGVELRPLPEIIGYAAGSDGHIYSFLRPAAIINRQPKYRLTPHRMKPGTGKTGYLYMGVRWRGLKYHFVHRLVCSAFHGPCPDGMECSHLNGDRADNRPQNLRWETGADNQRRRNDHGTILRGMDHPGVKLTEDQVIEIRSLPATSTQDEIAEKYGVNRATISLIVRKKIWKHVGGDK